MLTACIDIENDSGTVWAATRQGVAYQLCSVRLLPWCATTDDTDLLYSSVIEPPSLWKFPRLWLQHMLTPYSEQEKEHLQRTRAWLKNGRGYSAEQGTQPQTLGCALADSPAGLLAWLYEKLMVWSDDYPWDDDESELLTYRLDGCWGR